MDTILLREHLEELMLASDFSGSNDLREIAKLAGLKNAKYAKKPELIDDLMDYYTQPGIYPSFGIGCLQGAGNGLSLLFNRQKYRAGRHFGNRQVIWLNQ